LARGLPLRANKTVPHRLSRSFRDSGNCTHHPSCAARRRHQLSLRAAVGIERGERKAGNDGKGSDQGTKPARHHRRKPDDQCAVSRNGRGDQSGPSKGVLAVEMESAALCTFALRPRGVGSLPRPAETAVVINRASIGRETGSIAALRLRRSTARPRFQSATVIVTRSTPLTRTGLNSTAYASGMLPDGVVATHSSRRAQTELT